MIIHSLKARLLYKFLMKERVLHLFVQEVIRQKGNYRIVKEFTQGKKNVMDFLEWFDDIGSLYWVQTIQGHEFWRRLSDESYMFYKKNEELLIKG